MCFPHSNFADQFRLNSCILSRVLLKEPYLPQNQYLISLKEEKGTNRWLKYVISKTGLGRNSDKLSFLQTKNVYLWRILKGKNLVRLSNFNHFACFVVVAVFIELKLVNRDYCQVEEATP